jgi:hypothetical protein
VAALERAGERLQADVVRAAVARERDDGDALAVGERVAAAQRPLRALDARRGRGGVLEGDVQPGDVPGRGRVGVVATSRQPVALTTTAGPGSEPSTVRTTSGMPQPWQSECPPRSGGASLCLRAIVLSLLTARP